MADMSGLGYLHIDWEHEFNKRYIELIYKSKIEKKYSSLKYSKEEKDNFKNEKRRYSVPASSPNYFLSVKEIDKSNLIFLEDVQICKEYSDEETSNSEEDRNYGNDLNISYESLELIEHLKDLKKKYGITS